MRIGYAVSNPELIRCLNDVKYSFNSYTMNQTAIACGVEAVRDKEYFEEHVRKIIETREWAKEELHRLGFEFPMQKPISFLQRIRRQMPADFLKH